MRCSCKNDCTRCKCLKIDAIGKKCSRITCKKCNCFRREKENENEDLVLSTQYQDYLDEMSSDSEMSDFDESVFDTIEFSDE